MLTVIVIPANIAEAVHLRAIDDNVDRIKAMQGIVGGYIECLRLDQGIDMWLNEEGKLEGLPANHRASWLAEGYLFSGHYIAGDVFLAASNDEGETVSLGISLCNQILGILDQAFS